MTNSALQGVRGDVDYLPQAPSRAPEFAFVASDLRRVRSAIAAGDGDVSIVESANIPHATEVLIPGDFDDDGDVDFVVFGDGGGTGFASFVEFGPMTGPAVSVPASAPARDGAALRLIDTQAEVYAFAGADVGGPVGIASPTMALEWVGTAQATPYDGRGVVPFRWSGYAQGGLAAIDALDNQLIWVRNLGDGSFDEPELPVQFGASPIALVSGDFDGNGQDDLGIGDSQGSVALYFGENDGLTADGALPYVSVQDLAAADVDDDGNDDLLVAEGEGLSLVRVERGGLSQSVRLIDGRVERVAAGDLNGDDRADVAYIEEMFARARFLLSR